MSARTLRRIGVVKSRVKERPQRPPPQDEASHAMYHHSPPPSMSSSPPHFGGSQDAAMSTPRTSKPKVFGIGVLLRYQEGNYFIEKMVEGGPAQRSGELNIGDCLVEVDGQICCNKTLNEVLEMIRGREGSTVKLTLFNNKRTDGQMYETVEIIRGDIPRKNAQKSAIIHVQPLVQVDSPHIQAALQQASVLGTPRGERMPITSQSASTPRLHYDPSSVGMLPPRGNQTPRGGSQTHRGERPSSPYGSAPSYEPQSAPATPRGGESAHGEYTSPSGFSTPGMGRSSSGPTYVDGAVLLGTQNVVCVDRDWVQLTVCRTMQGWMFKSKHSGIFSSFSIKHRWFVLRNSLLSYYRSDDDPHPINTLNMRQCKGMKTVGKVKGHFGLQLRFPWKDYFVWAPSNNERSRWAAAFKASRGE